ncbi:hypothetical protein [Agrobacterium vitis]|uniref:hypothetical protein n=1 Tax=Agrobacterium vitis TaxID=373 RepID=UPI001F2F8C41|nr:hypothetical protein [Agrobacterium vitis]
MISTAHEIFQNCPLVEKLRLPLARCKRQDRGQIAPQHDHQFRAVGHEIDTADQRAEFVGRQCSRFFIAKLVVKCTDFLMIIFCQIGMQQGRWLLRIVEEADQLFLARFERHHLRVDPVGSTTLQNKVEESVKFAIDPFDLGGR